MCHPVRVYYEDTDAGGIVFYANYLKFAERGRTEFLRGLGFDHRSLMRDFGLGFAVRRCAADYLKPALLDDLLDVETRVTKAGAASIHMEQIICRAGDVLARLELQLACIDGQGAPRRMPADMRRAMQAVED